MVAARAAAEGKRKGFPGSIAQTTLTKRGKLRAPARRRGAHPLRDRRRTCGFFPASWRSRICVSADARSCTSCAPRPCCRCRLRPRSDFLAAAKSSEAYDPHSFAIGTAALFGAACGAIGAADRARRGSCAPSCASCKSASRSSPTATGSSRKPRSAPAASSRRRAT